MKALTKRKGAGMRTKWNLLIVFVAIFILSTEGLCSEKSCFVWQLRPVATECMDAQVVFGYLAEREEENPSARLALLCGCSRPELLEGVYRLYSKGRINVMLAMGGYGRERGYLLKNLALAGYNINEVNNMPEAEIIKWGLVKMGVAEDDIMAEITSTNTQLNLRSTAACGSSTHFPTRHLIILTEPSRWPSIARPKS